MAASMIRVSAGLIRNMIARISESTSTSPRIVTRPEANRSFNTSTSVVTRVTRRPTGLRS